MVKTIRCPGNQEWSSPYNISSVNDDCVLISDWDKDFITMAYSSDKPTVKIPAQYGRVRDACLFNDSLYTAYDNFITKRTFNNGTAGPEFRYNPNINDIWSMRVLNESRVLLLSCSENRIAEYNPNSNQTKIAVSNLYISTFGEAGHADGQMMYPWGTTTTKQGILVADNTNYRISFYSTEGKFIKHTLTRNGEISFPMGLSYTRPFLWLSQVNIFINYYTILIHV